MMPQRKKKSSLLTAVAACVLLLSACGQGQPQGQDSPTSTVSDSPTASNTPTTPTPSSPAAAPSGSAPVSALLCKAEGLQARMDSGLGGGAAGSVYLNLVLTNSGGSSCLLRGFPGLSLTNDAHGEPIGLAASRDTATAVVDVVLSPGQSGTAVVRYVQPRNIPECSIAPAAGFRVYPPEDTASLFITHEMTACLNADISLLAVSPFRPA